MPTAPLVTPSTWPRGALLPRVDLNASVGIDQDRITSRRPESESLRRTGLGLSLSQLLWDGLGSQREIERVGHDRLGRYFDLLETTEQTALEATRAHYDVLRFQRLVALAEDNYIQHRYASQQIQSRFRAGIGRGVDLEQANARLSLAESNLTTEVSNLHDVMARYLRVIGEAPPKAPGPLTVFTRQPAGQQHRGAQPRRGAKARRSAPACRGCARHAPRRRCANRPSSRASRRVFAAVSATTSRACATRSTTARLRWC